MGFSWKRAAWGALPGTVLSVAICHVNPWFLDWPVLWIGGVLVAPAAVAGWLGPPRGSPLARLLLLGQLLVVVYLAARPRPSLNGVKWLVLGLDGATETVSGPLMDAGELPSLAWIRDGAHATLASTVPMFSPILWTTISTGRPPGEHGIQGFRVNAREVQHPRFWDFAEAAGHRVGTWKWLVTYPPRQVNGFQVPAWLAVAPQTHPSELSFVKELELSNRTDRVRVETERSLVRLAVDGVFHGFRLGTLLEAIAAKSTRDPRERRIRGERVRLWMDRDAFLYALWKHDVDLATFSIYSIDALSHRFWQFHEPTAFEEPPTDADVGRFRNVVTDAYRDVDKVVGELLAAVGEGTVVVALSDHGFQALQSEGRSQIHPRTARLEERLVQAVGTVDLTRLGGRMWLVPGDGQEAAARAFFAELLDGSGDPVFRVESLGQERAGLGLVLAKPEVDLDRLENDTVGGEPLSDYVRVKPDFTGEHHPDAIFWARGPGLPTGPLGTVSLLDVAPTLLSLMDIAPDPELPGRAVLGGQGSRVVESGDLLERQQWLDGREGVNEDRLRALGYIE